MLSEGVHAHQQRRDAHRGREGRQPEFGRGTTQRPIQDFLSAEWQRCLPNVRPPQADVRVFVFAVWYRVLTFFLLSDFSRRFSILSQ
jgi:hypothetical protein